MSDSKCQDWERRLIDSMAEDASPEAFQGLLKHAAECPSCGELLGVHLRLTNSRPAIPMPSQDQFAEMRGDVLSQIAKAKSVYGQEGEREAGIDFRSLLSNLFLNPLFAYALLILLGLSVVIYRGGASPAGSNWSSRLASDITRRAVSSNGLQESSDSPYILSNVSIRSLDGNRVSLSFDVTAHLDTIRSPHDPLVREALAQSLISPSDVGAKLNAISFAGEVADSKVKEGLVYAALNDQNAGVRLSALGVLTRFDNDEMVERTCLEILRGDASVQMRLQAIDYLGRSPELLRQVMDQRWSEDPALRLRAATYLQ